MTRVTPLLRWAGSKRLLLPTLAGYWVEGSRYVEPFAGSAALFFHLQPTSAVLGDSNSELISTYVALRDHCEEVIADLATMPPNNRDFFYALRHEEPPEHLAAKRASRFIYLNRYCFNGLYRTNRMGRFNVPFGGKRSGPLPEACILRSISALLERAEFVFGDFEQTLARVRQGDFVYLDPPYWVDTRRVFRQYSATVFNDTDLSRLFTSLERLEDRKIPYLLSYADSAPARAFGQSRSIRTIVTRRNIAGFAGARRNARELLIAPSYVRAIDTMELAQ